MTPGIDWWKGLYPTVIAGPCSAESERQVMATARALADEDVEALRVGVWKPRTRPNGFAGVGDVGLEWARNASLETGLPVAVEVALPEHVEKALEHRIDILWIGARTTASPFAVQAIADALRGVDVPVLVKNPVNPDLGLWIGALERLTGVGVVRLAGVHRGFSTDNPFPYRNKPLWEIPAELQRRIPSLPLICDPSHIAGNRALLAGVARKALERGYAGLMIEVHPDPELAFTDSRQQITPEALRTLLAELRSEDRTAEDYDFLSKIDELRDVIDLLDHRMLDLLSERMDVARQIGRLKRDGNIAVHQPERWEHLVSMHLGTAEARRLSPDLIRDLFRILQDEAISQQTAQPEKGPKMSDQSRLRVEHEA